MVLPRFVVLKSNHNKRHLHYTHEDIYPHESLNFYAKEVVSPYVKFEVEMAKSGNGLVHLRCCYNNKYWVRRSENDCLIVATADKPEEDQSKWSCTLFKPVYTGGDSKTVQFLYAQLGHYACLGMPGVKHYDICLYGCEKAVHSNGSGVCTIIDWESLLIMPKHVAFKGDNGCHLGARWIEGHQYLQFASTDIGDPTVGNEVFTHDGSIRIKCDTHT